MVFESIVVDILNRLLGDYFENLDTSQLKLGIWGGDVVLRELLLKNSAMDDLGLPFKVVVGKVGTLRMKIPWKSLYTSPVELNLQDLLLLVTPSYSVKYDEKAEEKALQSAKEKELTRLDEIRARERQKQQGGDIQQQEDTFTEKLITQIIKNVQIRIDCIHIRYEDDVTKPDSPFGFGVILKNLHLETTDEDWKPAVITEMVETVNKMATLEGLALYWNSSTQLIQRKDKKTAMIETLREIVTNDDSTLTYILGPIASTAKVFLTPNPERSAEPFSKPKFLVDLVMEELGLGVTNLQFQDIMELIESIDFMTRAQYYRKYRPDVNTHKGYFRKWWMFAFKCIVEEEIRRKRQNWDWMHMKRHRNLCRTYADAYYKKLTVAKMKPETVQNLNACEKALDVFNLTLVRKQVEVKVEREGQQKSENEKKQQSGGWFGWSTWFGDANSSAPTDGSIGDIAQKFEEALTPAEKAKLYAAIDYSENALPLDYPTTYQEYQLKFRLHTLMLNIRDALNKDPKSQKIMKLVVDTVETRVATRPVKNGLRVEVFMSSLEAEGLQGKHDISAVKFITSKTKSTTTNLLEVLFENNPLDSQASQKIVVQAQPIEVIYHGKTVVQLVRCFALPPEMQLSKLKAAALSSLNEWRESSTAGLQHLIETRGEIDLNIELLAPYLLIPSGGVMDINASCLAIDLGELKIKSKPRKKKSSSGDKQLLNRTQQSEEEHFTAMRKVAYDTFVIELTDFQVLLSLPGENIAATISTYKFTEGPTPSLPQTLIKSSQLLLELNQSLIPDDPRFARIKLEGHLPSINLDLSEYRLSELVKLLVTLPFLKGDVPDGATTTYTAPLLSSIAEDPTVSQSYAISKITYETRKKVDQAQMAEFIELFLKFTLDSIEIQVSKVNDEKVEIPFVTLKLMHMQAKLTNKTFSSAVDVGIGGLTVCALQNKTIDNTGPLYLLKTPMTEGIQKHLFKMQMFSIMPDCPIQLAGKVKQSIKAEISCLDVILHKEALLSFIQFGNEIAQVLEIAVQSTSKGSGLIVSSSGDGISLSSSVSSDSLSSKKVRRNSKLQKLEAARKAVAKKHTQADDILLQIDAKLESLTVQISSEEKNLMKAVLSEMKFSMNQKTDHTTMNMELKDLGLGNLDPRSIYTDIIKVDSDKVVAIKVVMYDDATKGKNYYNVDKYEMSVKIETGSPKIFFVYRQLDELLAFIDNFSAAKDAVMDASAAAAMAARENVEQAYRSATRMLLDIELNAPIIFVPRNEHSQHGILADLGRLTLKNKFSKQEVKHLSATAILDNIDITLKNMKLSRVLFDTTTQDAQSEVLLLDPVTFKLSITRNLSTDWYHGVPDITVEGTLWNLVLRASNEDYEVIMNTLMENIAYTPEAPPIPITPTSTITQADGESSQLSISRKSTRRKTKIQARDREDTLKVGSSTSFQTVVPEKPGFNAPTYTAMAINIDIPQLQVVMYQKGAVHLDNSHGIVERDEDTAFADFAIRNTKMNMTTLSNSNMNCPISIEEITLKDIRPGARTKINLIQKKDPEDSSETMAKFSYKTDSANKRGVTMTLDTTSLRIVLCLDYLLQIVDFFSMSEAAQHAKPDLTTKRETFGTLDAIEPEHVQEVTADNPRVSIEIDEGIETEPFCGFYNFSETEIILVESMEKLGSNALLLHCEVSLKQQEVSGRSNMMGTIGNLVLSTCDYSEDDKHEAIAEVISPMSVTLVMNSSEAVGTLIDVNISDIFIRMTAGTLELLLKIISTIGASTNTADSKVEAKDHSDLWHIKKNSDMNFWFLNPDASVEVGLEALQIQEDKIRLFKVAEDLKVNERLVLESGCIVFTFETGLGSNTMPMVLIETDIDLQMFDWSSNMTIAGRMKLEAAYYNPTFGLWEYLVEPVETRHHGRIAHQPWEMLFEYSSRVNPTLQMSEDEAVTNSYMSVALESSNIIELTVTRTALEVMDILKDDFQAVSKKLISEKAISTAAYCIVNDTGSDVRIFIKEKNRAPCFVLIRSGVDYEEVLLKHGTSVNLSLIDSSDMTKHHSSVLREQQGKEERLLCIEIDEYEFRKEIPVNRASKRYYALKKREQHHHVGFICDIWVKDCSKIVTLRGVVQIVNDLQVDVDVYYKEDTGKTAKLAGTALSGQKFNLPIPCTYTRTGDLFFAPEGFAISSEPFSWAKALQELMKISQVSCKPRIPGQNEFFLKVIGEAKQALHESTNRKNLASQCCYISLEPPLIINNLLPVQIGYFANEEFNIAEKGVSICATNLHVSLDGSCKVNLKIPDYNKQSWRCNIVFESTTPEISQWSFTSEKDSKAVLTVGIHREIEENEVTLHVYIPYWMINRTGLNLIYKGDDKSNHQTEHPKDQEEPVLFSFPGKAFFSKKSAFVKVKHIRLPVVGSDWSEKFSLDVAGSCGSVICKSPIYKFQIGVEIQLSSWGLTKYIIFTPRFYLVNQCSFGVSVKEKDKQDHLEALEPKSCIPFWPESSIPFLIAIINTDGRKSETKGFRYDSVRHTLLQLRGKYGGLHVDIHFSEAKTVITFTEFIPGQAPVLLVNGTTDCPLEISEEGLADTFMLLPNMCQMFTWKDPVGARILRWTADLGEKKSQTDKLLGDGCGTFSAESRTYYWISFLDGLQRVLLFTPDIELSTYLQAARENEIATAEYIVMLHGIGISLVDNEKLREIMYMRIASSEISWESSKLTKKKRFKPLPYATSQAIEMAYQNYLNQKAIHSGVNANITLDAGVEIDFASMIINKPQSKHIRRVFQTGIWLHYKALPNSAQFHAKINRLQIDNQMADTIFRVVFYPVVPPKSVTSRDVPKPFVEVSIMQRVNAHSYVQQFKYFKILVQEFHIKLDISFVSALVDMFSGSSAARQANLLSKFNLEYEEARMKMKDTLTRQIVSQGQKHFYDFLHFSPLKVHVSFSMGGSTQLSNHFLNLVLASVGVTLTEIQDVVFKISCLELQHSFLSGDQLYNEVYSHYTSQAIKQLYVLVFGLDALGNPYGLAMGVASGIEAFFYEPIQGAIQGPGEFAEGLALGVKTLLGSTVGGAAGAFSKITGTLGKGIAALTMDEDYQKKRRENMHHRGDAAEGLARSGKGLVMGFFDGVTGLVTKPYQGAKEGGVGGFFKGVGKGTIGLVARPAAGVVDFASGSFDAVKKCSSTNIEVHRMRPPRCIPIDSVLQPYVKHEAEGVQLLQEIEKGKYNKTDLYIAHALINPHGIYVVLLTNKRLMYLKRDELFGGWGVEWTYIWEDFAHPPDLVERGLLFTLKTAPHKKLKMLGSATSKEVLIPIYSAEVCTWMLSKIEEAMKSETGVVFTDGVEATELSFV